MQPDLAHARESQTLEQFGGGAEEEPVLRRTPGGRLGDHLDTAAAVTGDLVERGRDREPGDAAMTMSSVDEHARDAPSGGRWGILRVGALVLEVQALRRPVLAPPLGATLVIDDQSGVRRSSVDEFVLQLSRVAHAPLVLDVVRRAPAPAVDPVVALDEVGEEVPRGAVQRADGERRLRLRHRGHGTRGA